jgi:hypothetical protein
MGAVSNEIGAHLPYGKGRFTDRIQGILNIGPASPMKKKDEFGLKRYNLTGSLANAPSASFAKARAQERPKWEIKLKRISRP